MDKAEFVRKFFLLSDFTNWALAYEALGHNMLDTPAGKLADEIESEMCNGDLNYDTDPATGENLIGMCCIKGFPYEAGTGVIHNAEELYDYLRDLNF